MPSSTHCTAYDSFIILSLSTIVAALIWGGGQSYWAWMGLSIMATSRFLALGDMALRVSVEMYRATLLAGFSIELGQRFDQPLRHIPTRAEASETLI